MAPFDPTMDAGPPGSGNRTMRRWVSQTCVWLFAAVICLATSGAESGPKEPLLELDTGGHLGLVRGLLYTPDGKEIVTAGDDKTIRIWDAVTGNLQRTLRGEMDFGEPGKILAIALSPDGKLLAAGGHLSVGQGKHVLRLYDFRSGQIVRLFEGHSDAVLSLAFSPDGKLLASGGTDDTAILWDVATARPLIRINAHKGDVNTVRFSKDGVRLITGGDDNLIRIWNVPDGKALAVLEGHTDKVVSLAVSPRDGTIASGGLDGAILLWDGERGASLGALASADPEVMALAFSPDGSRLLSGAGRKPFEVRVRQVADGKLLARYRGHDNIVMAAAFAPDGAVAATSGGNDNELHIWRLSDARVLKTVKGIGSAVWSVGFSADGKLLGWGTQKPRPGAAGVLTSALRLPRGDVGLGEPRPLARETPMIRAVQERSGIALRTRASGEFGYADLLDIAQNGRVRATIKRDQNDGYVHNVFAIAPDGRTIISGGGHGRLDSYDLDGRKLRSFVGHTSDVWSVSVSSDGKLLASGGDDQTVRVWNLATGANIATLLAGRDGAWVIWTDEGYYAASPSGDRHVGWRINSGEGNEARFVTAAQLKQHFYRPDVVARAFVLRDARRAANEAGTDRFALAELVKRQPPVFSVESPVRQSLVGAGDLAVRVRIAPNLDPVASFDVTVGGVRALSAAAGRTVSSDGSGELRELSVPMPALGGEIEIRARNEVGQTVETLSVRRQPVVAGPRGTLFLVSVGVDKYEFFKQDLRFAGADARAILDMFQNDVGAGYQRVLRLLLAEKGDEQPLASNVEASLEALREAGPDDTIVLFLAGHGVNDGPNYLFLPADAKHEKGAWQAKSVVKWEVLQELMEKSRGRRIMLVDTCHSGNAFNPRLIKDAADASIVVFAATDADTLALERPELGHGVFTYALLEGLKGKADSGGDRKVAAGELIRFVTDRVAELTGGKQRPTSHAPGADFIMTEQGR